MKVLLVNHFPLEGSGSGIYTKNLAIGLNKAGHEVSVIFPEHSEYKLKGIRTKEIIFNNGSNNDWIIDFNFPCFTTHPKSNYTFYEMDQGKLNDYINIFEKTMIEEIEEFKPDIIHAQHIWLVPYIASKLGIPYVITAHGTDLKGYKKDSRFKEYTMEAVRKANGIITISKDVDNEVEKIFNVPKERRILLPNGYDNKLFTIMEELSKKDVLKKYGINNEHKYIVTFAGKLTHFKGVDVLLKAGKIYENQLGDKVVTLIVGNGELYDELLNLKNQLKLKNVFMLGHVNQNELAEIYNISDVNIVPSRNEPFGLVALEAMGCGTVVIGTDQGGLKDFITEEVGGLIPVDDDLALGRKIIRELTRDDKDERAINAFNYVKDYFSWEEYIGRLEKIYRDILY